MTVKELIEKLKEFPEDKDVMMSVRYPYLDDYDIQIELVTEISLSNDECEIYLK